MEIVHLLIGSDIKSTNNHLLACHRLSHALVSQKLRLLIRIILCLQIQKFTSKKSDARCIIGKNISNVTDTGNISIQLDMLTVCGHILLALKQ